MQRIPVIEDTQTTPCHNMDFPEVHINHMYAVIVKDATRAEHMQSFPTLAQAENVGSNVRSAVHLFAPWAKVYILRHDATFRLDDVMHQFWYGERDDELQEVIGL